MLALITLALAFSGCSSPTVTPVTTPSPTPVPPATPTPSPAASATPTATPAPTGQPLPAQASVTIKDFAFDPGTVHIATGGTVTWTNQDITQHTVTFSDSGSPLINTRGTYSKKFDAPGSYSYHCSIHPSMTGTVVVG